MAEHLISKKAAIATGLIVVAFLVLVPVIPDRVALCAPKDGCPDNRNPPMPYVSGTFFVSGIGIVDNGGQLMLVYTPWMCGTTYYAGGAVTAYGCNRGSIGS